MENELSTHQIPIRPTHIMWHNITVNANIVLNKECKPFSTHIATHPQFRNPARAVVTEKMATLRAPWRLVRNIAFLKATPRSNGSWMAI